MKRIVLATLRFCLCAWVGVAMYYVVVVVNVMDTLLWEPHPALNKFNHPAIILPPYYEFAFPLLGLALLCGFVSLWDTRIGLLRRGATLLFVVVAFGMVTLDYAVIYRNLVVIFAPGATSLKASDVMTLFPLSRLLKGAVLAVSIVAAALAIWPEQTGPVPNCEPDPAL